MAPLGRKLSRRDALGTFGVVGAALAAGCASSSAAGPSSTTATATTAANSSVTATNCVVTPEETAGPYPDRLGMVNTPAFFRQDVTEGRSGLPVTLALTVVNLNKGCAPLASAAVEIWQCDASGNYSEYAQPATTARGRRFFADCR
jgi:protocatechuate 3,4-dioxygenase beta subunit